MIWENVCFSTLIEYRLYMKVLLQLDILDRLNILRWLLKLTRTFWKLLWYLIWPIIIMIWKIINSCGNFCSYDVWQWLRWFFYLHFHASLCTVSIWYTCYHIACWNWTHILLGACSRTSRHVLLVKRPVEALPYSNYLFFWVMIASYRMLI